MIIAGVGLSTLLMIKVTLKTIVWLGNNPVIVTKLPEIVKIDAVIPPVLICALIPRLLLIVYSIGKLSVTVDPAGTGYCVTSISEP